MDKDNPPEFRNRLSETLSIHAYNPECTCSRCKKVGEEPAKPGYYYTRRGNVMKLEGTPKPKAKVIQVDFKARKVVR